MGLIRTWVVWMSRVGLINKSIGSTHKKRELKSIRFNKKQNKAHLNIVNKAFVPNKNKTTHFLWQGQNTKQKEVFSTIQSHEVHVTPLNLLDALELMKIYSRSFKI